eukprot:TRINITY_DN259_c3_g1_i1.p1 TRINITY_DN259_c3_g1~~TRINITY_DN259_c3_g1_i1.p1  ORF type:complete len:2550 (+),score=563.85 TRINITY_DN259_c3_g1_i1:92-7651(+)
MNKMAVVAMALLAISTSADIAVDEVNYECSEGGFDGNTLFEIEASDLATCQTQCSKNKDCWNIVFDDKKTCLVMGKEGSSVPGSSSLRCEKKAPEPTPTPTFECHINHVIPVGELATIQQVESVVQCQAFCTSPACKSVSFTKDASCIISESRDLAHLTPSEGSTTCVRTDLKEEQTKPPVANDNSQFRCQSGSFSGTELFYVENVASLVACQDHCNRIEKCATLSYDNEVCTLYDKDAVFENGALSTCFKAQQSRSLSCRKGMRYGNILFAIGGIATIEECQSRCEMFSANDACKGVNYDGKSCELVSSLDVVEDNQAFTGCGVTELAKEVKADKEAIRYQCNPASGVKGDELVLFGNVKNIVECQGYCSTIAACSAFTHEGSECHLLGSDATFAPSTSKTTSCKKEPLNLPTDQKSSTDDYTCTHSSLLGGDIGILVHVNEATCRYLCDQQSECGSYTLVGDVCVLKSIVAVEGDNARAIVGNTCGKKSTEHQRFNPQRGYLYHHEIDQHVGESLLVDLLFTSSGRSVFSGTPLKTLSGVSRSVCASRCHVLPDCEYFSFGPKGCFLLMGNAAITEDNKSDQIVWRRSSEVIDEFDCSRGSFVGGTLSTILSIPTPQQCVAECRLVTGCVIAVHHSGDSRCVLKGLHAVKTSGLMESSTACVSTDIAHTKDDFMCTKSVSYSEGSISLVENIPSLAACRAHCSQQPDCVIVQYMKSRKACELKSKNAVPEGSVSGIESCSREAPQSRSVSTLAVDPVSTELVSISYVNVRIQFLIDNLTPDVWGYHTNPQGTDATTILSVDSKIRTPVGIDPVLYSKTVYHAVITELSQRDSIFMSKLNPTLRYLGLNAIDGEQDSTWSVSALQHEWTNSPAYVAVMVDVPYDEAADYSDPDVRSKLARQLAEKTGEEASLISFLQIVMCNADGQNCAVVWTAATQDTAGGRQFGTLENQRGIVKVLTTFDIPEGHTAYTYCLAVTQRVVDNDFGWSSQSDCEVYRESDTINEAPIDTPIDTQSDSGRTLLEVNPSVTTRRSVRTQQSDTGTEDGHRRTCTDGWQTAEYGVMSNSFNINENPSFVGTLSECIDKCTSYPTCFAFSRNTDIAASEPGECWFKKTVLPAVGDQHKHDTWGTYVVSCPPDLDPCRWYHMDGVDASGPAETTNEVQPIVTSSECSALCELMPDCVAISYKVSTHACKFVRSLPNDLPPATGIESSVCYRASATRTPCDDGICGIHPSNACFPMLNALGQPSHRCLCADGFQCEGKCDANAAHACTRSGTTLQDLFIEAMTKTIGVDKLAIVSTPQVIEVADANTDTTKEDSVTISTSKIYVPTTHTIQITLSNTDISTVLENDKLTSLRTEISNSLDLLDSEVTVKSLCSVLEDGQLVNCYDEEQNEVAIPSKPIIKMSPSNNWASGASWCMLDSNKLACPKTTADLEQLVADSAGEMVETRTYWSGARCTTEDCSDASSWFWEDSLEPVDWPSFAHGGDLSILSNGDCSVFKWDTTHVRWSLNPVPCSTRTAYPVCQDLSSSEGEHPEACNSGSCNLRIYFNVFIQHLRTIHFYTLPTSESLQRYYPSVILPVGMKIVDLSGRSLGYVDSTGKTSVIPYPPIDAPVNPVLHSIKESYTYVSEMLTGWVQSNVDGWLTNAGLSAVDYNSACHVLLTQKHVKCDSACTLVEPLLYQRSSCKGSPPCSPSECSYNGRVRGFMGHCTCTCDHGFTGTDCGQCAAGHVGYPQCSGPDEQVFTADPLYEVFHLFADSGSTSVSDNINDIITSLKAALNDISESVSADFVCPISACAEVTLCKDSIIPDWPVARQQLCTFLNGERDATTLDSSFLWMDTAESVIEVTVKFTAAASSHGVAVTEAALQRLQQQTFPITISSMTTVYGPSVTPPKEPSFQQDTTATIPVDYGEDRGAAGTDAGAISTKEVINWIPVYAMGGGIFILIIIIIVLLCCYCRRKPEEKTTSGEDIFEKYGDVADDTDADSVTIYKDADEPMGILWDDHTLCIDVVRGSAASRYNVDQFIQRRIAKVNGTRVSRLSEIKEAVEGKTVVQLEFEPRAVPLTVCVSASIEDFHEPSFIKQFTSLVSSALELENFSPLDVDIQSVVSNFEGDTEVTMNLVGLTASQVATISRLCHTPGTDFQKMLNITGASMGKNGSTRKARQDNTSEDSDPLWICCQWVIGAAEAAGCYLRSLQHKEGLPMWHFNSEPSNHYVYATAQGYWVVVNDKELIGRDLTDGGYILRSKNPHNGLMPHMIKEWISVGGSNDSDVHIIVSQTQPRTRDFNVGQRVVFPTHLELEDGIVIAKRSEGIVMGDAGDDLVKVYLLNEAGDYVTVSSDAIDSPDGPKCSIWKTDNEGNTQWMGATIVKVRNRLVKVHFDCGYCEDEWVDIEAQAGEIRLNGFVHFSVGDRVQLEPSYEPTTDDSIKKREVGTIISIGDGMAKPYLVEGEDGSAWYSATDIVLYRPLGGVSANIATTANSHTHTGDLSTAQSSDGRGGMQHAENSTDVSFPFGTKEE